jgi:hypothetical protein
MIDVKLAGVNRRLVQLALAESPHFSGTVRDLARCRFEREDQVRLRGRMGPFLGEGNAYQQYVESEGRSVNTILSEGTFDKSREEQDKFSQDHGCSVADRKTHRQMVTALLGMEKSTGSASTSNISHDDAIASAERAESYALNIYRNRIVRDESGGLHVLNNSIIEFDHRGADACDSKTAMLLMQSVERPSKKQLPEEMAFVDSDPYVARLANAMVEAAYSDELATIPLERLPMAVESLPDVTRAIMERIKQRLVSSHLMTVNGHEAIVGEIEAPNSNNDNSDFMFRHVNGFKPRRVVNVYLIADFYDRPTDEQKALGAKLGLQIATRAQSETYLNGLEEKHKNGTMNPAESAAYSIYANKFVQDQVGALHTGTYAKHWDSSDVLGHEDNSAMLYVGQSQVENWQFLENPAIAGLISQLTRDVRIAHITTSSRK